MLEKFRNFLYGLSVNWTGKLGATLTTSSFIIFVVLQVGMLLGVITNAYVGLVTYLLFPALFVIGLILIPISWYSYKKGTGKTSRELLKERFEQEEVEPRTYGSKLIQTIAIFTIINIIFLSGASMKMLQFMDRPYFCGTACHDVMNPEWVTYQDSPHARVKCVDCHVGEGGEALIDSKLNGLWQIISAAFELYEKPIPTPVHQLRPARETCEKCHWPDKFYGHRLKNIVHYAHNEVSSPQYTTLDLKIDTGKEFDRAGIHWHIAEENEVRYASLNDEREEMIWVEVRQPDGSFKRYTNTDIDYDVKTEDIRVLDCVDCHNRATHIYKAPQAAIDEAIFRGVLPRNLPYISKQAYAAITGNYADKQAAFKGIENELQGYYRQEYPEFASAHQALIDSTVAVLQDIYDRNIHHGMNIDWGAYPSQLGHESSDGCFRCHNGDLVDSDGNTIDSDCVLCHSILAMESDETLEFLIEEDTTDVEYQMRQYLKREFLEGN
ncbi:MAG: hypothetical protein GF315_15115 [candidate division Zixibacteria bacterium]|nr:hypothetical protein [candidate division Zixibacteria bacterium]